MASAHAFLLGSDPAQGARLVRAPSQITLRFSEPVVTAATTVTVRLAAHDRAIPATVLATRSPSTVRVELAASPNGVYVVSWEDRSADDDHAAAGEFAFSAGPVVASVPATVQAGAAADPVRVVATALFLIGLSMAGGGAATGLFVDRSVTARSAAVRVGLMMSIAGAAGAFMLDMSGQSGHFTPAATTAGLTAALATATSLGAAFGSLVPVLVGSAAAGAAWAATGHPASVGGWVGLSVNAVHVVVGTAWLGSLGYTLVAIVRHRRARRTVLAVTGRYARLALPLVVALAATGAASAGEALPSSSALYSSGYGQLILAKTGLFASALLLAAWSRRGGVLRQQARTLLRAVPVEAGVVATILVLSAVLAGTGPPVRALAAMALLGPPPISGPVARAAGLAGQLNVAVAAGSGELQLQVLAPNGAPVDPRVAMSATGPDGKDIALFPRACGSGCFTQALTPANGTTMFRVTVAARGWHGGTWSGSVAWPPQPSDPALLTRLVATMDAVAAVTGSETVTSDSTTPPFSSVLPPTTGRQLMGLEVYGTTDPADGESQQTLMEVQPLALGGPGLQLYVPGVPAWVTLWLDSTGRLARERIVDPGHVITDTFDYPQAGMGPGH